MKSFNIAGIMIDNLTLEEAVCRVETLILRREKGYIVTPNAAQIVQAQRDAEFKECYDRAFMRLPDSMPLMVLSRMLGNRLQARITGSDLIKALVGRSAEKGYGIFLLGAEKPVVEKVKGILEAAYPGIKIVGLHHGYFADDAEVITEINRTQPDILFIALGFVRQEKWIQRNFDLIDVSCACCIGGVFDVIAGKTRRAPVWMQQVCLEWFWRFLQEPRRLFKRYLTTNCAFLLIAIREALRHCLRTKVSWLK